MRKAKQIPLAASAATSLAKEQCSSSETAHYKAQLVESLCEERHLMADLTGGLGVDFSALAPLFERAVYVERNADLCALACRNFADGLNSGRVCVVEGDGISLIESRKPEDAPLSLLYLDPARRDGAGRRVSAISDCQPDAAMYAPRLVQAADTVMVKLSPMLDITLAVSQLRYVSEVHAVSLGRECKELLFVLRRDADGANPLVVAADAAGAYPPFSFRQSEEAAAEARIAPQVGKYLYEPSPAVMKAGAFKLMSSRFEVDKLHPNTHLYTSDAYVADFPGRRFEVMSVFGFSKADVRTLKAAVEGRANVAVRNFPGSAEDVRRRLKVKDGGQHYVFATTMADGRHLLVDCLKAE